MGSHPDRSTLHDATSPDFVALGVPARLVDALTAQGISSPFPIQTATLPDSLSGRDVLGRGRTGSGKTLAFALPLVARTAAAGGRPTAKRPRALVLVPTRELATQVQTAMAPLADASGLRTMTIFGGVGQRPQVTALARGVDVVIACPGRLEDLMRQGHVRLDDVAITVIDEADHMADLGFLPAVRRILDATDANGQRLLFSATLDNGVDVLVRRYLSDPVRHSVDDDATTEPDIEHHVLTVTPSDKAVVVTELASGLGRSLLFTRTKHSAKKLARDLTQSGVPAVDLHGNLSQAARDRNLGRFRSGEVRVLVATDVAARGIHVDDVALVVHVDPPTEHKAYTHRSGRTARAGASGVVVTLQTQAQRSDVASMTRRAGITPSVARVSPGAEELLALTGPRAAHVEPAPVAKQPQGGGRSRGPAQSDRPRRRDDSRSSSSAPRGSSGARGSSRRGPSPARSMSAAEFSSGRRSR
ncbi:MAG TPA: DEAD/DEAH box helicase [Candidatus Nanopelagicales bacterium]|nr:DEAD/DEAH box helicase [Candidatus Nanopelagicales bacterium]